MTPDRYTRLNDVDGIVLRESATRWVWVLVGSVAFAALGAALALAAHAGVVAIIIGVLMVLLFGFCAVVAVRQLLNPGWLVVSGTAIEVVHRGRTTTFAYKDCGPFTTWRNPSRGTVSVVFDYAPDGDSEINRTNRRLMGGSRSLFDNYGMSPEALAKLLNDVRQGATPGANDGGLPAP
jgi:energy-coupling factor transporter transmembrane protein EcfT